MYPKISLYKNDTSVTFSNVKSCQVEQKKKKTSVKLHLFFHFQLFGINASSDFRHNWNNITSLTLQI